jgi:hypothetical protein
MKINRFRYRKPEPRVLVPPRAVSVRTLKMLDKSVVALKKGLASAPVGLSVFNKN